MSLIAIKLEHDLPAFADERGQAIRRGATRGADRLRARAKLEVRQPTRAALGDRAANTWRDDRYPTGGKISWHPTVHVWSKWPAVVRAHIDGATIRHKQGLMLAIPTDDVPNKIGGRGGRRKMSPVEVEAQFNQDLILRRSRTGNATLAFVDVLPSKNKRGWRRKTAKRLAEGRRSKLVLMFILVKQVTLRPRLPSMDSLADDLAPIFRQYIAQEIARELDN